MQANRRKDTKPEIALRSELHRRGLRFRKDHRVEGDGRSSRVDIVFTRQRLAVFVDGCFWHGCPQHMQQPKANSEWWRQKLETNQRRDQLIDDALERAGWRVLRLWEHVPPGDAADRVQAALAN